MERLYREGITDEERAALYEDYDGSMKDINECIYSVVLYSCVGIGRSKMRRLQFERIRMLFNLPDDDDCYQWFMTHKAHDPDITEKLLSDALRTGKWKELLDELQAEYHRREGGELKYGQL